MTPKMLRGAADDIRSSASDKRIDQEQLIEEQGFDVVAALECVARRLERESDRRKNKGSARPGLLARHEALRTAAIAVANDCDSAEDVTPAIVALRRVLAGAVP